MIILKKKEVVKINLKAVVYDENDIKKCLARISHQIIEKNEDLKNVCLLGVKTRGIHIANRLKENIQSFAGSEVECEILDVTSYRDDLTEISINSDVISIDTEDKTVIIADDVLYTGRTARAAMEAVIKKGRPKSIQLAVLVDRGHRELPIRADYVGKNIPTSKSEAIKVNLKETDGKEDIEIYEK